MPPTNPALNPIWESLRTEDSRALEQILSRLGIQIADAYQLGSVIHARLADDRFRGLLTAERLTLVQQLLREEADLDEMSTASTTFIFYNMTIGELNGRPNTGAASLRTSRQFLGLAIEASNDRQTTEAAATAAREARLTASFGARNRNPARATPPATDYNGQRRQYGGYGGRARGWYLTLKRQRRLKAQTVKSGHLKVTIRRKHQRYHYYVHTLVLQTFHGMRPPGEECRHLDGDPENNQSGNLCWGTRLENSQDRTAHGRVPRGETNGKSKLTVAAAVSIVRDWCNNVAVQTMRVTYRVAKPTLYNVLNGRTWGHVTGIPKQKRIISRCWQQSREEIQN